MNYSVECELLENYRKHYRIGGQNLEPHFKIYYRCKKCFNIIGSSIGKMPDYFYLDMEEVKSASLFIFNNEFKEFECSLCREIIAKEQQVYAHFFFFLLPFDQDLVIEIAKINSEIHWSYALTNNLGEEIDINYEEASIKFFHPLNTLFRRGLREFKNNNIKAACNIFKKILLKERRCQKAWLELAKCYFLLGKEEAINIVEKLLKEDSENIGALLLKAWINYSHSEFDEAELICNKIISLYPDIADAYYYLSLIRLSEGKNEEALKFLNNVLEIDPNYADAIKLYYLIKKSYERKKD